MDKYTIGDIITGEVTGVQNYGVFVKLDNKTQGLVHISEYQHGFTQNLADLVKIGDKVKVQIIDIDEYSKQISLSIRSLNKLNTPAYPARNKKRRRRRTPKIGFKSLADQLPQWYEEGLEMIEKDQLGFNHPLEEDEAHPAQSTSMSKE